MVTQGLDGTFFLNMARPIERPGLLLTRWCSTANYVSSVRRQGAFLHRVRPFQKIPRVNIPVTVVLDAFCVFYRSALESLRTFRKKTSDGKALRLFFLLLCLVRISFWLFVWETNCKDGAVWLFHSPNTHRYKCKFLRSFFLLQDLY